MLDLLIEIKMPTVFKGLDLLFPSKSRKSHGANKYYLDFLATLKAEYDILNETPYALPSHQAQNEGSCLFLGCLLQRLHSSSYYNLRKDEASRRELYQVLQE